MTFLKLPRIALLVLLAFLFGCDDDTVAIGSKTFPESAILAEAMADVARDAGANVDLRAGLGDSALCFAALQSGDIDAYPEYTGTLLGELLSNENLDETQLEAALNDRGLTIAARLGFNNTYAIGVRRAVAEARGLRTVSDLRAHPDLRFAFSTAFVDRPDGWPGLRAAYGLPHTDVTPVDHALAYVQIDNAQADATDVYSTDADIAAHDLVVLTDDLGHFPRYDAVVLCRLDVADDVRAAWAQLDGAIDEDAMIAANRRVVFDKVGEGVAAAELLGTTPTPTTSGGRVRRFLGYTVDHALLVAVPMTAAVLLAVPLGVWSAKGRVAALLVPGGVGMLQTIPSLALLVLLVPWLGLGFWPAATALTVYALLPIVRTTQQGLLGIPPDLRESAAALGLSAWDRWRLIELPLALPTILAGIKTSAVLTVGFAVLGGFVGAGGYGEPIFTGLRRYRTDLMLEGALGSAAMAVLVSGAFWLIERVSVSRGLR